MMTYKNRLTKRIISFIQMTLLCISSAIPISCNEDMEQMLKEDYPDSGTSYETGRVLLIVVDGAGGKAVQQTYNARQLPNIQAMLPSSQYTFQGLSDSKVDMDNFTNDRGWANLLTGTTKHGVGEGEIGDETSIESLTASSFLTLLKKKDQSLHTSLYASSTAFYTAFSDGVDKVENRANDEAVKESVVEELASTDEMPSDVIVAQFNGVEQAGKEYGFYVDKEGETVATSQVVSAITKVDGYIGQIMETLKSRKNFKTENWLVIVTSNYGGEPENVLPASYYYDYMNRNTFTLMYNSRFSTKLLLKPSSETLNYKFFSPIFAIDNYTDYAQIEDPNLFDMDWTDEGSDGYTIQFMLRITTTAENNGQVFLSKAPDSKGQNGWVIVSDWMWFKVILNGQVIWSKQDRSHKFNDGRWHTGTFVFDRKNNIFKMFFDGLSYLNGGANQVILNNKIPSCTDYSLTIGKIARSVTDTRAPFHITNIQFYNTVLPDEFIAKNHGRTRLEELRNDYWDNLIGYWPNDREEDFEEEVIKNYAQGADQDNLNDPTHFHFSDRVVWGTGESYEVNIFPTPDATFYTAVFNTVDVSYQIFQWLGITVDENWKLEGNGWPLNYSAMDK